MSKEFNPLSVWHYGIDSHAPRFWWNKIKMFFQNICFAWQRATKGYCDRDIWGLDEHLRYVIRDTLRRLSEIAHGAPVEMFDHEKDSIKPWRDLLNDMADRIDASLKEEDENVEMAWKKYEYAIKHKKNFTSQQINFLRDAWMRKNKEFGDKKEEEYQKVLDFLREWHEALWD